MGKNVTVATTELFYGKIHSQKRVILEKKKNKCFKIAKISDIAWAIAFAKSSIWVKN